MKYVCQGNKQGDIHRPQETRKARKKIETCTDHTKTQPTVACAHTQTTEQNTISVACSHAHIHRPQNKTQSQWLAVMRTYISHRTKTKTKKNKTKIYQQWLAVMRTYTDHRTKTQSAVYCSQLETYTDHRTSTHQQWLTVS